MKIGEIEKITELFGKIFLGILVFVVLGGWLYHLGNKRNKVKEHSTWVIADVYDISSEGWGKGSRRIKFEYHFKGIKYQGHSPEYKHRAEERLGKRYLLEISSENPNIYIFSGVYEIPDSIQNQPPQGWEKLPNWAEEKK